MLKTPSRGRTSVISGWCDEAARDDGAANEAPARAKAKGMAMRAAKRLGRWGLRVMAVSVKGSQPAKRIPAGKDATPRPVPRCLA